MPDDPHIPEEAVEAAHATSSREHFRIPEESSRYHERIREVLQAAYPALRNFIEAELRERWEEELLSDEAVERVAKVLQGDSPPGAFDYLDGEDLDFVLDGARRTIQAILVATQKQEEASGDDPS